MEKLPIIPLLNTVKTSLNEENVVFLGQINFALAYKASQHTSLFLGYRYGYLGDSGPFDSVSSHVFEFGAVWDL
jgi:hypothetical protein